MQSLSPWGSSPAFPSPRLRRGVPPAAIRRGALALLCALALLGATHVSGAHAQGLVGRVRIVQLVPDAGPIDVLVDGRPLVTALPFRAASPYLPLSAGAHTLALVPAAGPAPVRSTPLTVAAAQPETVVTVGSAQALGALVLPDDTQAAAADSAALRFVYTGDGAPAVDLTGADGTPLFAGVAAPQVAGPQPVAAGTYDLHLRAADSGVVLLTLPAVALEAGQTVSIFAGGHVADTSLTALVLAGPPLAAPPPPAAAPLPSAGTGGLIGSAPPLRRLLGPAGTVLLLVALALLWGEHRPQGRMPRGSAAVPLLRGPGVLLAAAAPPAPLPVGAGPAPGPSRLRPGAPTDPLPALLHDSVRRVLRGETVPPSAPAQAPKRRPGALPWGPAAGARRRTQPERWSPMSLLHANVGIYPALPPAVTALFRVRGVRRLFQRGEALLCSGCPVACVHLILRGGVAVARRWPLQATAPPVRLCRPGDAVGVSTLVAPAERRDRAIALEETETVEGCSSTPLVSGRCSGLAVHCSVPPACSD